MRIVIASDHGGFELKEQLIPFIEGLGHSVENFGCYDTASVDYSDYGIKVGEAVAKGDFDRGIVICGTGIGISIAANKVKGVRCALCTDPVMAALTREHNDANVLSLGGRIVGVELAKGIVAAYLDGEFSQGERHKRRLEKIALYEEGK